MVLASVGIVNEIAPLPLDCPQTLQVPRLTNHIPSTLSDTVTDSNRFYYLQRWILDISLHHQLLLGEEDQLAGPSKGSLPSDPKAKQTVTDEFVLMQVIPISKHTEIFIEGLWKVPIAFNPTFAMAVLYEYSGHPTSPMIPPDCLLREPVLDLHPPSVLPDSFSSLLKDVHALAASSSQPDLHQGIIDPVCL